jgi:tetratricopeptide (TPR) repeat protein
MTTPIEHYKQGLALFGQKKNEEAAEQFREALELKPDWLDALHALATAQSKLGRHDEALSTIARVIELDPDDAFAYTSQSIFLQRKGLIPEAEAASAKARMAAWKKELKTNPNAPPPGPAGGMSVVQ